MPTAETIELDVVIFGGGAAGLWLLDELHRAGHAVVLLEANELGAGQTIAAQGIIHGGLKYTLTGLLNPSAEAIREMPSLWRSCLRGEREPNLTGTRVRAEYCHLWRTESLTSRLGMIGASKGLVVAPQTLDKRDWPTPLRQCPGQVMRLDEQVIATQSLIADLANRHQPRLMKVNCASALTCDVADATVKTIQVQDGDSGRRVTLTPRHVVLTAGGGNAALRQKFGLTPEAMQRRPLHVPLLRGDLPDLNGHCVDGAKTRVTITTDHDSAGRTVWQLGGQVTEDGVRMSSDELIAHAKRELAASVPGIDIKGCEWTTFRVDRAERATSGGRRPDTAQTIVEGNVITGWPTKLALAPQLAATILATVGEPRIGQRDNTTIDWTRPAVAAPPWDTAKDWLD